VELIFVRHGLPESDMAREGEANPPLTALGQEQAARTARYLSGISVTDLVTSPSRRALETAAPIGEAASVTARVEADIDEYPSHGRPYLPVHEMRRLNSPDWQWVSRGVLPDYVDGPLFRRQVVTAVERVVSAAPGRHRVVLVCHAGVINAYLGHVLGIAAGLTFPIEYTSISRVLAGRDGRRTVLSVNETQHVADLLPSS
jgi:broad specificity phosphatase PhoE